MTQMIKKVPLYVMFNMWPINIQRKYNDGISGVVYSVAYAAVSVLI